MFFLIKFSNLWIWFDLQIFPCSIMLLSKVIEMDESFKFKLEWLIDLICLGFYLTQLKLKIQSEIRYIFWVFLCDLSLLSYSFLSPFFFFWWILTLLFFYFILSSFAVSLDCQCHFISSESMDLPALHSSVVHKLAARNKGNGHLYTIDWYGLDM